MYISRKNYFGLSFDLKNLLKRKFYEYIDELWPEFESQSFETIHSF